MAVGIAESRSASSESKELRTEQPKSLIPQSDTLIEELPSLRRSILQDSDAVTSTGGNASL